MPIQTEINWRPFQVALTKADETLLVDTIRLAAIVPDRELDEIVLDLTGLRINSYQDPRHLRALIESIPHQARLTCELIEGSISGMASPTPAEIAAVQSCVKAASAYLILLFEPYVNGRTDRLGTTKETLNLPPIDPASLPWELLRPSDEAMAAYQRLLNKTRASMTVFLNLAADADQADRRNDAGENPLGTFYNLAADRLITHFTKLEMGLRGNRVSAEVLDLLLGYYTAAAYDTIPARFLAPASR